MSIDATPTPSPVEAQHPMPPPHPMRSGEWSAIQEDITRAVTAAMQAQQMGANPSAYRSDFDALKREWKEEFGNFKEEMRGEFKSLREQAAAHQSDLRKGDTTFALLGQRIDWIERDLAAKRKNPPTDPALRTLPATSPEKTDPEDRPLIHPRLLNALFLAFAAAAGAGLWSVLAPKEKDPAPKDPPAVVAPKDSTASKPPPAP